MIGAEARQDSVAGGGAAVSHLRHHCHEITSSLLLLRASCCRSVLAALMVKTNTFVKSSGWLSVIAEPKSISLRNLSICKSP